MLFMHLKMCYLWLMELEVGLILELILVSTRKSWQNWLKKYPKKIS